VVGALGWVAVGTLLLGLRDPSLWRWRDDAVITLSHARGWVELGVPSVSAAGERVEGYSAPLQFFAAALYYRLGGSGWDTFLNVQVLAGFALCGYFVSRLLHHAVPGAPTRARLVAGTAVAVVGLSTWVALGWFGSGMENSITVPLLFGVMATTLGVLRERSHRGYAAGILFGLAGIARTELAVFLLPALAATTYLLWRDRPAVAARVAGIAIAIWALVHGWRSATFGTLLPNSAIVQGKTSVSLTGLVALGAVAALLAGVGWRWHRASGWLVVTSLAGVAFLTIALVAAADPDGLIIDDVPARLVIALAGLLMIAAAGWTLRTGGLLSWAVILLVGMAPMAQELVLGPARLDPPRIGGQSLILLASGVGVVALWLLTPPNTSRLRTEWEAGARRSAGAATVLACGGLVAVGVMAWRSGDGELCCAVDNHRAVLDLAAEHAHDTGLPRTIVAAPDIGKLSFEKAAVLVDLGFLGDPVAAEIRRTRPDLLDDYLLQVQVPDVVEVHGIWSCYIQDDWVTSAPFATRYRLASLAAEPPDPASGPLCGDRARGRSYVRSSSDPGYRQEIDLTAALARRVEEAPSLVAEATERCAAGAAHPLDCQWIRRSIQRAMPELRAAGADDATVEAFLTTSPTPELDRLFLRTPPGWSRGAASEIVEALDRG
jgi:hypothetical protein